MRVEPRGRYKPLPVEAETLLKEGRLIDAVKSLRESHGVSLKDAKDWIDTHLEGNPILRAQLQAKQSETRRKFFFTFFIVDAVVVAVIIYWFWYRPL
jgi:hypothetical protein